MKQLDKRLDSTFLYVGEHLTRSNLLKRAAVVAAAVPGYSAVSAKEAAAGHCADTWGACDGFLCCDCYNGCKCRGEPYYCGCRVSPTSYVQTAAWSRCCGSERYDWWDCGYHKSDGSCAGVGGCPGRRIYCNTCDDICGQPYVSCYRCTFRVIVANAC